MVKALPPGQRRVVGFPRFGTHLARPAPPVSIDPVIAIRGSVNEPFEVPLATLAALPRRELRADFHCVTGWSATDLFWEGVSFEVFYRRVIALALGPDTVVTHLVFRGLDRYSSVVSIEDALGGDVLIADRLDGRPLSADHGAPARLVSPTQYGYISTKHLCRIDVHTEPPEAHRSSIRHVLIEAHPRARVGAEERHGSLPAWLVRPAYRALKGPFLWLCARGSVDRGSA
ncbi:MAG: molybdopterin-dependent oxidoreductase [Acidimicrobiales bacterium]